MVGAITGNAFGMARKAAGVPIKRAGLAGPATLAQLCAAAKAYVIFNSAGTYGVSVPSGINLMDLYAVGAGAGGGTEYDAYGIGSGGGGGGSQAFLPGTSVQALQELSIVVGVGGAAGANGAASTVKLGSGPQTAAGSSTIICQGNGGSYGSAGNNTATYSAPGGAGGIGGVGAIITPGGAGGLGGYARTGTHPLPTPGVNAGMGIGGAAGVSDNNGQGASGGGGASGCTFMAGNGGAGGGFIYIPASIKVPASGGIAGGGGGGGVANVGQAAAGGDGLVAVFFY